MASGFVRVLWGTGDSSQWDTKLATRALNKTMEDVRSCVRRQRAVRGVTYVYGEDNFQYVQSLGFDARLLDKRPILYPSQDGMWRHKLEAIRVAMDDFDEIIYLDHDVQTRFRRVPRRLWRQLKHRAPLQSSLRSYRRVKIGWRQQGRRLLPAGAFIYMRDRKIAERLVEVAKAQPTWTDEHCMAYVIDELDPYLWSSGVDAGIAKYGSTFAPYCYRVKGMVAPCAQPLFVTRRERRKQARQESASAQIPFTAPSTSSL